jgi:putative transposase
VIPDVRTLKEQHLWVRTLAPVADLVEALGEFKGPSNERWIIRRHGYRTPRQVRRDLARGKSAAA